ncbi:MAG: hypothetical protein RL150_733 [Candidatus Parcubacteria bacterium]|jgi:cytochrome c-type biogenesis protein CcmE
MVEKGKVKEKIFLVILFVAFLYAVVEIYVEYIVREDFTYFLTEEEVPNQFDANAYLE